MPALKPEKQTLDQLEQIAEQTTPGKALADAVREYLEVVQAHRAVLAELPLGKAGMSA